MPAPIVDVLRLDEGADLAALAEHGAGPQVGERADDGAGADDGERRVGALHDRALADLGVDERRVGADDGARARCTVAPWSCVPGRSSTSAAELDRRGRSRWSAGRRW